MFFAIRQVVGINLYTDMVHKSWVKIFSSMLRVIVPVAVAHELSSNEAQKNRLIDHENAFGYHPSEESMKRNSFVTVCPIINVDSVATTTMPTSR
jgi:hypothetical protein